MGAAMDDQRLVALAQEGNPDAFSLLVERHQTMVYNLALGKTGSPQDAEEVTQTAFLKAWQGLPAFQGKAAFSSWLYRLTVNAAIDLLRQRSRRPQTLSLDDPDLPPVPDPAEDPQAQAEAQERRRQLWQAIDALPEVHRTPFLLREMEGYSYREIAKALGLEEGTVKSRLARARVLLRSELLSHGNFWGRDWSRVPQTGTAPSKKKKRLLPWAACAAAAVVLMVFGFTHLALPGGSSGLSEGFAALFSLPGDREESTATAEDSTQSADPEEEASDQTDGATPPDDGAAEGATDAPPSDSAGEGNKDDGNTATDTPSDPSNEDPGGQPEDPGNDPGQDDPTNGEDPTTDPGLSQAEAQSLLIAYLAQQGRTLELIPLGQSGDVWRFSGRESDGTVISFFMVSRTDGTISEVPVPPTDTGPSVGDAN